MGDHDSRGSSGLCTYHDHILCVCVCGGGGGEGEGEGDGGGGWGGGRNVCVCVCACIGELKCTLVPHTLYIAMVKLSSSMCL